jgi:hypothetical protein
MFTHSTYADSASGSSFANYYPEFKFKDIEEGYRTFSAGASTGAVKLLIEM